jgi:dGTPase
MNAKALAPYAVSGAGWTRRLHDEPPSSTRGPFHRDRDRLIHATAFRRLKHKTQVFAAPEGDHFRTRLTHSLEVAQIARTLARALGFDEDLTETLALAHDLGHTPFGHAGEEALDRAMARFGGFDHNAQTLRIVTRLEHRYPKFDGLNLTFATLDGLVKHNGPIRSESLPFGVAAFIAEAGVNPDRFGTGEAQAAALADDVAYCAHDLDDGLRAGLFDLDQLGELALVGEVLASVRADYPGLEKKRVIHETVRRLIGRLVDDLLFETRGRLRVRRPESADDIVASSESVVAFTASMRAHVKTLKDFLFAHMYRHGSVVRMMTKVQGVVAALFEAYLAEPKLLPPDVFAAIPDRGPEVLARGIADFIAGMTDNFALAEHKKLFDPSVRA